MERESDVTQGRFQAGRERAVVPASEDDLLNSENRDAMKGILRFPPNHWFFVPLAHGWYQPSTEYKRKYLFVTKVVFCDKKSPQSVLIGNK